MKPQIIIIGAGVIGAASAYQLACGGAQVTVLASEAPRATDASFGWVNASFYADDAHYRLRDAGISAFERLIHSVAVPVQRVSSLCWETSGAAFEAQLADLRRFNAKVRCVNAATIRGLEPRLGDVPDSALLFENEAVADSGALADVLLGHAQALGARVIAGAHVTAITEVGSKVTGVRTTLGGIPADQVLVAAGTGTENLMSGLGLKLPMLKRPGLMLWTRPIEPIIHHVLASVTQEVRQLSSGALLAPAASDHQSDESETVETTPHELADLAMQRLRAMLPGVALAWDRVMVADRPMPQDGLPAVGALGPAGLYVATMHSGITLAALMGELVAQEMLHGTSNQSADLLAPYRPRRFA